MITEVRFLKPFVFVGTVGMQVYNVTVDFAVNSSLGAIHGFLDDALATELEGLGLVEAV